MRPWWYVEFAAHCGVDVCASPPRRARAARRDARPPTASGARAFCRAPTCARSGLSGGRAALGLVPWLRSWSARADTVFSADDPLPGSLPGASVALRPLRGGSERMASQRERRLAGGRRARDEWSAFVAASPTGSAYSLPAYLDALAAPPAGGSASSPRAAATSSSAGSRSTSARRVSASSSARVCSSTTTGSSCGRRRRGIPPSAPSRKCKTVDCARRGLEQRSASAASSSAHAAVHGRATIPGPRMDGDAVVQLRRPARRPRGQWGRDEQNLRRLVGRCEREGSVPSDERVRSVLRAPFRAHERKGAPLYLPADAFRAYYESSQRGTRAPVRGALRGRRRRRGASSSCSAIRSRTPSPRAPRPKLRGRA